MSKRDRVRVLLFVKSMNEDFMLFKKMVIKLKLVEELKKEKVLELKENKE